MDETVVTSPGDMLAGMDMSSFEADAAAEPTSPEGDTGEESSVDFGDQSEETPELEADAESTPETDEEATPAEPADEAKPAEAAQAEDLPEGVRRGKDRNGKDGYWVAPNRWDNLYSNHKLVQEGAELIGEPLTKDALDLRHRAYLGQERLYTDLLSGEPESAAKVVDHILSEAQRALDAGEVSTDPIAPFAQKLYDQLQASNSPAYAQLRQRAAHDLVDEMYAEAAQKQDKDLWLSAQHFDRILGRTYKPAASMATHAKQDPVAKLQQENEQLRTQLNGRAANSASAQIAEFHKATGQSVREGVLNNAVLPEIADAAKQGYWAKNPEVFKELVADRLQKAVSDTISKDSRFLDQVELLNAQARRAASAQKRSDIGQQITNLYVNRAKLIAAAHKGEILKKAAEMVGQRSATTHARREAAQTQKGPSPNGTTVRKSLVPPTPAGERVFDPAREAKELSRLMSSF